MAKIAFLGLGQMGTPMAMRLLHAGHELTVWNRTPGRTDSLAAAGAVAGSPAQAGAGAEFAITMVATPEALHEVVLGENGLATALGPGQAYIDMSTVGPDAVATIAAARISPHGTWYIPRNSAIATGTVCLSGPSVNESANRNSFQVVRRPRHAIPAWIKVLW